MTVFPFLLLCTIILVGIVVTSEVLAPRLLLEGFSALPAPSYWSFAAAPRNDIGPDQEDPGFIRDPRYFNGYTDVSRIGASYDFCRMIAPSDDPTNMFFACALAGTDNLSSTSYRTTNVRSGFRLSIDDYMNINKQGRGDYCRILKYKDGSYQPICARSQDIGFDSREAIDPSPPESIVRLLSFYQGCVLWLRMYADMNDYVKTVTVQTAGSLTIDESIRQTTDGLSFNGANQYLRISDSSDLTLGTVVPIRSIRAWMVWVYFDEFTNNAKIFDFGNGSSRDNVFLGILGKGDSAVSSSGSGSESTVPTGPSGQQAVLEMSPQRLLATTDANVDEFTCSDPSILPKRLSPSRLPTHEVGPPTGSATLLYEVWDKQSRKMSIKVNGAIPLNQWTHVVITSTTDDAFRPDIVVYVNGEQVFEKKSGFLPSTSSMTNCYIGKSNWASGTQYANADTLFKGSLFDFRAYRTSAPLQLIQDSYAWGKEKLGLE